MKKIIITIILTVLSVQLSYSQFSADVDGSVDISPVNGNMQYVYPISNTTIDGYPLKVDMIYNSNVMFTAFDKHYDWIKNNTKYDGWMTLSRSMPVWMIGVNGFAVQVLHDVSKVPFAGPSYDEKFNYLPNYEFQNKGYYMVYFNQSTEYLNWLIEGYDYCNSMENPDIEGYQDAIRLLRSDGSVLELKNVNVNNFPIPFYSDSLFTGVYYENALNTNSYAIVEFDTTQNWPDYIRRKIFKDGTYSQNAYIKPRVLKYYQGDGLEYVFREYVNPYGNREDNPFNGQYDYHYNFPELYPDSIETLNTAPKLPKATIFYLEEINSSMGNLTKFERKYHKHPDNDNNKVEIYRGRAPLTEFANHKIGYSTNEFNITTFGRKYIFAVDNFNPNENRCKHNSEEDYNSNIELGEEANPMGIQMFSREPFTDLALEMKKAVDGIFEDNGAVNSRTKVTGFFMIKSILDPELRKTEIKYISKYTTFKSGDFSEFPLEYSSYLRGITSALISEIKNPNEMYKFEYWEGDSYITDDELWQGEIDFDIINCIRKFEIYDYKNKQTPEKLSSQTYNYIYEGIGGYFRNVEITSTDFQKDLSSFTTIYFDKEKVQPLKPSCFESVKTPDLDFTYPYKMVTTRDDITEVTETEYSRIDNIQGSQVSVPFYFYPVKETKSYKKGNGQLIYLSKVTYDYVFKKIEDYSMSSYSSQSYSCNDIFSYTLRNGYGWGVEKQTQNIFKPTTVDYNQNDILYKYETNFYNLRIGYKKNVFRTEKIWNKFETDEIKTKDYLSPTITQDPNVYTNVPINKTINIPPIYNIVASEYVRGKDGTILGGKIYNYDTTTYLGPGSPPNRKGALTSDIIVGKDGDLLPNNTYSYRPGWYRNFLSTVTNSLGQTKKLYYDYTEMMDYSFPSGKIMMNTEDSYEITPRDLFHQYEAPLGEESVIRKYEPSATPGINNLIPDKLRNIYERGQYGQITGKISPNGWYYKTEYDDNGRVTYEWHPYDYPDVGFEDNGQGIKGCIPIISSETSDDISTYISKRGGDFNLISHYSNHYTKTKDIVIGKFISSKQAGNLDDSLTGDQTFNSTIKKISLIYMPDEKDALHNGADVTDLKLSLFIRELSGGCIPFHLEIPEINYEQIIMLNCPVLGVNEPYCNTPVNSYSSPMVEFNLAPAIDFFKSLPPGNPYSIQLSISATDGNLQLPDLYEEFSPCLEPTSNGSTGDIHQDYTFHHIYNDIDRTVTSYSKIDDDMTPEYEAPVRKFPHSYSVTAGGLTFPNHDGRYTEVVNHYSAFNFNYQTDLMIGSPVSPLRTDIVTREYTLGTNGITGKVFQVIDQLGNITKTKTSYDGSVVGVNCDNTQKTLSNEIITPSALTSDIAFTALAEHILQTDDFYDFCRVTSAKNEENIKVTSIYDGLGQLRFTINDHGDLTHKNFTTKYEYDVRGNLIKVTNPKGQITTYEYDNFGNMIRCVQPDIGESKMKYDKTGNLRFKQDAAQLQNNKISFFEYDDLGRSTIIGEARLLNPASGYFNNLDPNHLAVTGGSSLILTSNPSVFWENGIVMSYLNKIVPYSSEISYQSMILNYIRIRTSNGGLNFHDSNTTKFNDILPPYMVHDVQIPPTEIPLYSSTSDFEDISQHPQNVKSAVWYDGFPERMGPIWKFIPPKELWETMSLRGELQNLKGQKAAIAYKENQDDPFNYVVMSYDARGRVESLMRWTENIGFDMINYTYNSMNQVISVQVSDAVRQFMVWNEYDNNGRLYKVYTRKSKNNFDSCLFKNGTVQFPPPIKRPDEPSAIYYYNKRGSVDRINYIGFGTGDSVVKMLAYDPRGWLDTMKVKEFSHIPGISIMTAFEQYFERNNIGNITKQKSFNGTEQLVQNYGYDVLNRITSWDENRTLKNETYEYDAVGNRINQEVNGIDRDFDYNWSSNKLNSVEYTENNELFTTQFGYNAVGSLVSRFKTQAGIIKSSERYGYNSNGRLIRYEKENVQGKISSLTLPYNTSITADKWVWGYKYNYAGQREQKRLITSPHGDWEISGNPKAFAHLWEYYLNGAFGEELIQYRGFQTGKTTIDDNSSHRVYLNVNRFHSSSEIFLLADGSKELSVTDNMGSVRFILSSQGNRQYLDYKPFGGLLYSYTGKNNRENADGSIYDDESELQMMGARMYDDETGRFTSIDPLWAAFPAQSPYSYAYNSPLTWRDPSGLAPEKEKVKEKEKDKLQAIEPDTRILEAIAFLAAYKSMLAQFRGSQNVDGTPAMGYFEYKSYIQEVKEWLQTSCGGVGGGTRTAATYIPNGSTTTTTTNPNGSKTTSTTFHFYVFIPTTKGTMIVPTNVHQSGIPTGETATSVMNAFVGDINKVLDADPTYYDDQLGRDVTVNIVNSSEIMYNGELVPGLTTNTMGTNKSVITFAGDVLTGHTQVKNYPDINRGYSPHKPYMIIAHEFAHVTHFALVGDNFADYHRDLREHYAFERANTIQRYYGDPLRSAGTSIFPFQIGQYTWWHYQIYGY